MVKHQKLNEMDLLEGQTEEITMMDLRYGPGEIMDQVILGKTFTITRKGKRVAVKQLLAAGGRRDGADQGRMRQPLWVLERCNATLDESDAAEALDL